MIWLLSLSVMMMACAVWLSATVWTCAVLAPQDFQFTATTLAPGAEAAMQLTLSAGSPRVSGYTVEIFYP